VINFAALGNDLYTGKRSIDFVGRYKRWYALSGVFCLIAIIGLVWHGLNLSLEFRGGSEFRVSGVTASQDYESRAKDAVATVPNAGAAEVTRVGTGTIRVQTEKLGENEIRSVQSALAGEFKTDVTNVSASFVGIAVGAYSSIFIATPLLVHLRMKEPAVIDLEKKATRYQARHGGVVSSSDAAPVQHEPDAEELAEANREPVPSAARTGAVRETHKYATSGPRNQPKRPPKSRR
jgi:preprotein translocase subunit SecF